MDFNICLFAPPGYIHSMAFAELAELLMYSLRELGYSAQIRANELSTTARNIMIGVHLMNESLIESVPAGTVMLNTEQIHADDTHWNGRIFEYARHFEVWDYSARNILKWRELGITQVKHFQIGYQAELNRIPKVANPPIDVLFYGSIKERRRKILLDLEDAGLQVRTLVDVYGRERDTWIAHAKVVLNMHHFQSHIFEVVRVFYLMSNAKAVVAEVSPSTSVEPMYLAGVAAAPYEGLVARCVELVRDDARRQDLEAQALASIAHYPQASFTAQMLTP